MLRAVFFGLEIRILDELRNCSDVAGVYVPPPGKLRWKPRDRILAGYNMRLFLKPFLIRRRSFFKKWIRTLSAYSLSDYTHRHGLKTFSSRSVNDPAILRMIAGLRPDIGIVANFGQILGTNLIHLPAHGFINWHPALLPRYRGPAPFGHILLNGETRSGVTWHRIAEKVDSGDILSQADFPVSEHDTINELSEKSVELGIKLLAPLLRELEAGTCRPRPQVEDAATYCPRLTPVEKARLEAIESKRRAKGLAITQASNRK